MFPIESISTVSLFHAGEQEVQRRVGVRDKMEPIGQKVVRDYMPEQHRVFFTQLPFILTAAVDGDGRPWASMRVGAPGFVSTPDPQTLRIAAPALAGDPTAGAVSVGAHVGLLGIELHTRRRNRMNGRVVEAGEGGFTVDVDQSFGNCPKYIQKRRYAFVPPSDRAAPSRDDMVRLDAAAATAIRQADTFFIATHYAEGNGRARGADVSHRGGRPGFVRIDGDATLTWPDFQGNFLFNTLGNLQANPHAGLLFPDFDTGTLLYLTGRGEIIWDGDEVRRFAGAERLVRFEIEQLVRLAGALPLRWAYDELSPALEATGNWGVEAG